MAGSKLSKQPKPNCWLRPTGGAVKWYRGYTPPQNLDNMVKAGKARYLNDGPPDEAEAVTADEPEPEDEAADELPAPRRARRSAKSDG